MAAPADLTPRSPRIGARLPAILINSDGGEFKVVVTDLSKDGFRLECEETLLSGERVTLRVDRDGDVPAQIRWVAGNEAGGVFLQPVKLANI